MSDLTASPTSLAAPSTAMEGLQAELLERLTGVRERTLAVVAPLSETDLHHQADPIMSPPVWDLAHIAAYEELWISERVGRRPGLRPDLARVYDAAETPRAVRGDVALLTHREALDYMHAVRERAVEVLAAADFSPESGPLTAGGAVVEMVAQHEQQHTETLLQAIKLLPPGSYAPPWRDASAEAPADGGEVEFPGGEVEIGAAPEGFAYDCERPRHVVRLAPFCIARRPVTNDEHLAFVQDGGYARRELWTGVGWEWRERVGAEAPLYWERDGDGGWCERDFDVVAPLRPGRPVCHVSAHEADAHARWAGARLPSEAEWECAAAGASVEGADLLGARGFAPRPAGAGGGASALGCAGMLGGVWEWTATGLAAYPGFRAFPYPEYSEVFFGGPYRVLRGGSWATQAEATRPSFRNWDLPERRQIFSGFRLAHDLEERG